MDPSGFRALVKPLKVKVMEDIHLNWILIRCQFNFKRRGIEGEMEIIGGPNTSINPN